MSKSGVEIQILDKTYRVGCPAEEREALLKAAHYLDTTMREIRGDSKILAGERVAVMAALNITHEFLQCCRELESMDAKAAEQVEDLANAVAQGFRGKPEQEV